MAFGTRFHDVIHGLHARIRSRAMTFAVYLTAFIFALPDMLDALAGIDVTSLLPAWLPGEKFSATLALARIFVGIYVRQLPRRHDEEAR